MNATPGYLPAQKALPRVFMDTPLASANVLMAEDELLHMLGDWGEAVAELVSPTFEDVTPPREDELHVKKE